MSQKTPINMKVVELREILKNRGLETKGLRSALIKRLTKSNTELKNKNKDNNSVEEKTTSAVDDKVVNKTATDVIIEYSTSDELYSGAASFNADRFEYDPSEPTNDDDEPATDYKDDSPDDTSSRLRERTRDTPICSYSPESSNADKPGDYPPSPPVVRTAENGDSSDSKLVVDVRFDIQANEDDIGEEEAAEDRNLDDGRPQRMAVTNERAHDSSDDSTASYKVKANDSKTSVKTYDSISTVGFEESDERITAAEAKKENHRRHLDEVPSASDSDAPYKRKRYDSPHERSSASRSERHRSDRHRDDYRGSRYGSDNGSRSKKDDRQSTRSGSDKRDHIEDLSWLDDENIVLDRYNSDMSLTIKDTTCTPKHKGAFGLIASGVKSTWGINAGNGGFEVKYISKLDFVNPFDNFTFKIIRSNCTPSMEDLENSKEEIIHLATNSLRIGFSLDDSNKSFLGEDKYSYAYDSEGYLCTNGIDYDIGARYTVGDVVGAYLDLDSQPKMITYTLNGRTVGRHEIPDATSPVRQKSEHDILHVMPSFSNTSTNTVRRDFDVDDNLPPSCRTFFPHVITRNSIFRVNFGVQKTPYFDPPRNYVMINNSPFENKLQSMSPIMRPKNTEVILMCGLPASGKTHWAREHIKQNSKKRFELIGASSIIQRMMICNKYRHFSSQPGWDRMNDLTREAMNDLIELASSKCRNFILDQTNVYSSIQRRKMRMFNKGQRRTAVVVVPNRKLAKDRSEMRQFTDLEHKSIDAYALNEMKANLFIPSKLSGNFDRIHFTELSGEELDVEVEFIIEEGKQQIPPLDNRGLRDNRKPRDNYCNEEDRYKTRGVDYAAISLGSSQGEYRYVPQTDLTSAGSYQPITTTNQSTNNNQNYMNINLANIPAAPDMNVVAQLMQAPHLAQQILNNPQMLQQIMQNPGLLNNLIQSNQMMNYNPGLSNSGSNISNSNSFHR